MPITCAAILAAVAAAVYFRRVYARRSTAQKEKAGPLQWNMNPTCENMYTDKDRSSSMRSDGILVAMSGELDEPANSNASQDTGPYSDIQIGHSLKIDGLVDGVSF